MTAATLAGSLPGISSGKTLLSSHDRQRQVTRQIADHRDRERRTANFIISSRPRFFPAARISPRFLESRERERERPFVRLKRSEDSGYYTIYNLSAGSLPRSEGRKTKRKRGGGIEERSDVKIGGLIIARVDR